MAVFSGLSTALTGLQSHQKALEVTSNNISNASNPDYTRERVNFSTYSPINTIPGDIGMGVNISAINRITDTFLFNRFSSTSATLKHLNTTQEYLQEIATYFPDVQDQGLYKDIKSFFNAWQNFANNPNDGSAKVALADKTEKLTNTFHFLRKKLLGIQNSINGEINSRIKEVNTIIENIANLNKQIISHEANKKSHANELRDKRDGLEKRLKEIINVQILKNGITTTNSYEDITTDYSKNYQVLLGGYPLIDGKNYHKIEAILNKGNPNIGIQKENFQIEDVTDDIINSSSEIGALLNIRGSEFDEKDASSKNGEIGKILSSLDALSASFINNVNSIYSYSAQENIHGEQVNKPVDISNNIKNVPINDLYSQGIVKFPIKNGIIQIDLFDNNGKELTSLKVNIKDNYSINDVLNSINEQIQNYDEDFDVKATLTNGQIKFIPSDTNNDNQINSKGSVLVAYDGSLLFNSLNEIEHMPLNSISDKLPLTLENGNFDIVVYNDEGKELARRTIIINKDSKNPKYSTIEGIVSQINTKLIDDNNDNDTNNDVDDYYHAAFLNGHFIISAKTDTSTYVGLDNDTANFGGVFQINNFLEGNNSKNISLKEELANDPSKIHAYKAPNKGDNRVANEILQLQYKKINFYSNNSKTTSTLYEYYRITTSSLANTIEDTINKKDATNTLYKSISNEYYALSGVNIDEELINLEKYQRGYQANAKVITTINKMLDALFNMH